MLNKETAEHCRAEKGNTIKKMCFHHISRTNSRMERRNTSDFGRVRWTCKGCINSFVSSPL